MQEVEIRSHYDLTEMRGTHQIEPGYPDTKMQQTNPNLSRGTKTDCPRQPEIRFLDMQIFNIKKKN